MTLPIKDVNKVYQTDLTKESGNCMQACLATIFGWDIDLIPDFNKDGKRWVQKYVSYMATMGQNVLLIPVEGNVKLFAKLNPTLNANVLVGVMSQLHKGVGHAVVGTITNGVIEVVHDPNPKFDPKLTRYEIWSIDYFYPRT